MHNTERRINYVVVSTEQDPRGITIQATYQKHFLELRYMRRETQKGFLWFGQIKVDTKLIWSSSNAFGCDTKEILDSEIQQQLASWAARRGSASFRPAH